MKLTHVDFHYCKEKFADYRQQNGRLNNWKTLEQKSQNHLLLSLFNLMLQSETDDGQYVIYHMTSAPI